MWTSEGQSKCTSVLQPNMINWPVTVISLTSSSLNELVSLSGLMGRSEPLLLLLLLCPLRRGKLRKVKTIYRTHEYMWLSIMPGWIKSLWIFFFFFFWLAKPARESHFCFVVGWVTGRSPVGWDLWGRVFLGFWPECWARNDGWYIF